MTTVRASIALVCLTLAFAVQAQITVPLRALLAPRVETVLASQMAGKIARMPIANGGRFSQNDELLAFDCVVPEAQWRKAKAALAKAQATLISNEEMLLHHAVGQLEVETARADVNQAFAEVDLRNAYIKHCFVKAPFSGRLVKRLVQPHQYVTPGTPLMEVLDDSQLKMELFVPSSWLQWLRPGAEFSVNIDETGRDYVAVVTNLGAKVISVSQTLPITAEVSGTHPELLAGMSGNAYFAEPGS